MKLLKPNQEDYPSLLSKIDKPPDPLYCLGNLDSRIFKNCLAVVGSRKISDYGQQVVEKLLPEVVEADVTIVSGFMHGIDEMAHRVCLENRGKTIAVLGCGIDLIRPTILRDLHQKILDGGGLIVSELEGEHPPFRWTFVRRNRIISGLSQATLVVEAGEESGSLGRSHRSIVPACARANDPIHILRQQVTGAHQGLGFPSDPVQVVFPVPIPFLDGQPWIAISFPVFSVPAEEEREAGETGGQLRGTRVDGSGIPSGVCAYRHTDIRQPNAGTLVEIAIQGGHKCRIFPKFLYRE